MFTFPNLCILLLIISSVVILFQDFRDRLVSLWVIILFAAICIFSVIYFRDAQTLLFNGASALIYLGIVWLALKLYMFFKFRRNEKILDTQIGLADVLLIFCIGLTFNTIGLVFFFCVAFVLSLVSFVLYTLIKKKSETTIPLAGLLAFFFTVSVICLNLVESNYLIDCSFVNP